MKEKFMKTCLTPRERFFTLAGTTIAGTIISSLIGKHFIPQAFLTAIVLYLISGNRPSIVYATIFTFPRDYA